MKGLVRKNIRNITPYKAGKPIEETRRELGLKEIIKLASNENPLGPSPKALEAARKVLGGLNRYPDSQSFYLKQRLGKHYRIAPSMVVLGNGSDELIDIIIKTFVEDNEHIVTSRATFLEYEIIANVNGRRAVTVPLKDFKYDLDAIRKKVTARTKLVFIANPNNPTGTYVNKAQLEAFITSLPKTALVVLDEAYDSFIDVKDFPDSLALAKKGNCIVLKTFSKAFGLAGLRIGYAIADAKLTPYLEKVRQPFNVNLIAQAAAQAGLDDKHFLRRSRAAVLEGKRYLYRQLDSLGIRYVPSVANFILVDVRANSVEIFKKMLTLGVIVRDMQQYGLINFIRVTIGTAPENRKFIAALKKVLA